MTSFQKHEYGVYGNMSVSLDGCINMSGLVVLAYHSFTHDMLERTPLLPAERIREKWITMDYNERGGFIQKEMKHTVGVIFPGMKLRFS